MVELEGDVKALGICEEVHGNDIEEFLLVMDNGEVEEG